MSGARAPNHDRPIEPRLHGELASWWPLLSAPADYAEEAALFGRVFRNDFAFPSCTPTRTPPSGAGSSRVSAGLEAGKPAGKETETT